MSGLRIHAVSLGCPKNRVDTERLLAQVPGGVVAVDDPAAADVVLLNTCAFIQPAVEESVAAVLELAAQLEEAGSEALLAVAGCLVARYGKELEAEMPEVGLWFRPGDAAVWQRGLAQRFGLPRQPGAGERLPSTPPGHAYLKIGEGCDHGCRYCTIPRLRGRLRSDDDASLEREARSLLQKGVRELVLVAQDLTAHGADRGASDGLKRLLERLLPLQGLEWLRLMYLYPSGLTDELLGFLKAAGRPFIPYFDIPFQHVHPEVLERMGRPGLGAGGASRRAAPPPGEVVSRVRSWFPEAAIRTTFIVGYPGETEAQFEALERFVAEQRLQHVGVFGYYAEEGTAAAKLSGRISREVTQRRCERLMALQREISAELLEARVGERMQVLVDAPHEEWPGLHVGRVWLQAPEVDGVTYISGPGVQPGAMVVAEIAEAQDYDLVALA